MVELKIAAAAGDATAAIQRAIDAAHEAGGGRVVLMAGTHASGGLRLLSGVELNLSAGAVLEFAAGYDAYTANVVSVIAEQSDRAMLVAQGARDVAVTGAGEIRAPGRAYIVGDDLEVDTFIPAKLRPRVLVFEDCTGVRLEGITIADSPMWTMHLVACSAVVVAGVKVNNDRRLPNTDGLVIDSCNDVLVERVRDRNGGRWRVFEDDAAGGGDRDVCRYHGAAVHGVEPELRAEDWHRELWRCAPGGVRGLCGGRFQPRARDLFTRWRGDFGRAVFAHFGRMP